MQLIQRSGDANHLKGLSINLSGEQFRAMVNDGVFPESLDFGFDVLNERALTLTLENIDGVKKFGPNTSGNASLRRLSRTDWKRSGRNARQNSLQKKKKITSEKLNIGSSQLPLTRCFGGSV